MMTSIMSIPPRSENRRGKWRDTHRTDTDFLRNVALLIYVDLAEHRIGIFAAELFENGRNDPARATPRCPEIDEDNLV